jgi:hypothetical protein
MLWHQASTPATSRTTAARARVQACAVMGRWPTSGRGARRRADRARRARHIALGVGAGSGRRRLLRLLRAGAVRARPCR